MKNARWAPRRQPDTAEKKERQEGQEEDSKNPLKQKRRFAELSPNTRQRIVGASPKTRQRVANLVLVTGDVCDQILDLLPEQCTEGERGIPHVVAPDFLWADRTRKAAESDYWKRVANDYQQRIQLLEVLLSSI
jgi:hypothetical protein